MGNFTAENARGLLNQQLKKWRQKSDMDIKTEGPPHAPMFRATLGFKMGDKFGNKWIQDSHATSTKKEVQKELALKLCRRLFRLGAIPKFARSVTKVGSLEESLKDSKYHEQGMFGLGLPSGLKARLRTYLEAAGYEVPPAGEAYTPDTVLLRGDESSAATPGESAAQQVRAVDWAPPGSPGCSPWPARGDGSPGRTRYVEADPSAALKAAALPVARRRDQIVQVVASAQVTVIQGATGSGKTTQVPQFLLDADDGNLKTIVVVQPRRLPAMTVAQRVALERGEPLGVSVGYAVRFDAVWPSSVNSICYMTTGLLLKRLHRGGLAGISHVIVDEVHERDLNNDLLLAVLRAAACAHSGLKIVLMSATIDPVKFQLYMDTASSHGGAQTDAPSVPSLAVEGRCFEVETYYLEDAIEMLQWPGTRERDKGSGSGGTMNTCDQSYYSAQTVQVLGAMPEQMIPLELARGILGHVLSQRSAEDTGGVLIFLPTWGMMSFMAKMLREEPSLNQACHIVMLHSQVPKEEQLWAFQPPPPGLTKVVISTNIAESSVTIDDISVVIDSCRVKLNFFSVATGLSQNQVSWTGRMNMEQRKGRAGRTRPGVCYRLCSRQRFEAGLEDEVPPEITRAPLTDSALLVKSLNLGDVGAVLSQCLDPPSKDAVDQAISELCAIGAMDEHRELTPLGRIVSRLPINPHFGVALMMGHWLFRLGDAFATMCAAMSFDEPFHTDKTAGYLPWSISEAYAGRYKKHSDQFLLGMVHQEYARLLDTSGQDAALVFCRQHNLHTVLMRQVYDASRQLKSLMTSEALGSLALEEADVPQPEDDLGLEAAPMPARHDAIRDWGPQDWQWGALQLLLAIALPHLGVHLEKRHIWVSEDTKGAIHKASVNCTKGDYKFPSPIFAFLDQVKEGGWKPPRCRQSTNIPALLVLLRPFSSSSIAVNEDGNVVIADWLVLDGAPSDTISIVLGLRMHLQDLLSVYAGAAAQGGAEGFKDDSADLTGLLKELLTRQNLTQREPAPGAAGAWSSATPAAGAWSSATPAKGSWCGQGAWGARPAGGLRPAGGIKGALRPAAAAWGARPKGAPYAAKGAGAQWGVRPAAGKGASSWGHQPSFAAAKGGKGKQKGWW